MSDKVEKSNYPSPSVASYFGILFVGLKLGHVIDWPWIWVTAPFWIPLAVVSAIAVFLFSGLGIAHYANKKGKR